MTKLEQKLLDILDEVRLAVAAGDTSRTQRVLSDVDRIITVGEALGFTPTNRHTFNRASPSDKFVGKVITKHSGKPFKSGEVEGTVVGFTTNPDTNREGFLMDDGSIVDCHQCKLA